MNDKSNVGNVKDWRARLQEEMEKDKASLAGLQRKIKEAEQRIELLDRLLAMEGDSVPVKSEQIGTSPDEFLAACERIMRERGEPMHIRDIHAALIESGIPIPGKGNQANVISRLQRSDGRFIRTGRGMYGLPEFGLPEVRPTRTRKRPSKARNV